MEVSVGFDKELAGENLPGVAQKHAEYVGRGCAASFPGLEPNVQAGRQAEAQNQQRCEREKGSAVRFHVGRL